MLKLLQWRCPPERWWLKTPAHMLSIDALDAVYPDARFVMTHRDVAKVLPSVCALYDSLSRILTERPDPAYLGAHNVELWRGALERLIDFRDRGNEDRFHDLSFDAVQRGSAPRGRRGSTPSSATSSPMTPARRMRDWWSESSKDRSGPHTYTPETFGLDLAAIREQFAFYYDRFDVPVEHGAEAA